MLGCSVVSFSISHPIQCDIKVRSFRKNITSLCTRTVGILGIFVFLNLSRLNIFYSKTNNTVAVDAIDVHSRWSRCKWKKKV